MLGHHPLSTNPLSALTAAGGNVTVTPTTLALTLTTFAPTVSTPRLVTPTTLALTISTFAPTVTVGVRVTPTTLALTISAFAPTVSTPRLVTPTTLALTISAFAPTVSTPRLVTPGTLALTVSAFVPTVSTPRLVTPTTLALTISTFAPTVTVGNVVTPSTLVLTITTFAPTATGAGAITGGGDSSRPMQTRGWPISHYAPVRPVEARTYRHVGRLVLSLRLDSDYGFTTYVEPAAPPAPPKRVRPARKPALVPAVLAPPPEPRVHRHAGRLTFGMTLASSVAFHDHLAEVLAMDELLIRNGFDVVGAEEEYHAAR